MQNFTDIPSSRTLSDSLAEILNNDKTAISCNSGTTFPTTNLQIGMLCYRSDQLKLYQLIGTNPDNWRFIMDLSSGIDAQFAAKLNAATYTAADVLAKLLTVDGAGSGLDADLLDGQHASAFAAAGHNHDAAYLGKNAKAADSDLLDGFNSTAFVRSVNGAGPDANGNATVNVDLSSRVAKTGDTMSGQLTIQNRLRVGDGGSAWIDLTDDESPNGVKRIHANSNLVGFVGGDGNWKQYVNESGQIWAANYGWLHEAFFSAVNNCAHLGYNMPNPSNGNTGNCYNGPGNCRPLVANCGNLQWSSAVLEDGGSTVNIRSYQYNYNCNCNCDCCCCFAPGTLVRMADGSTKAIEDVAVGERVVGLDGSEARVAHTFDTTIKSNSLYRVNGELLVTGGHLLRVGNGWAAVDLDVYPHGLFFRSEQTFESAELVDVVHQSERAEPVRALRVGDVVNGVTIKSIEPISVDPNFNVHNLIVHGSDGFVLASGYAVDGFMRQACGGKQ